MKPRVPDLDKSGEDRITDLSDRLNEIELRLLDAGARAKENLNREADQRYWLRWLAVSVCTLMIAGMGVLLWHAAHSYLLPVYTEFSSSYIVAVYLAPIVSMTSLAIALLVAAFRAFKDSDGSSVAMAATETAKVGKLIS